MDPSISTETVEKVAIGLFVLVIGYLIYKVYMGHFTPLFASAIGSLGLVAATLISLTATRTTIREQRRSRKQEIRPFLQIDMGQVTLSGYGILVRNIGEGAAKDISVTVTAVPEEDASISVRPEVSFKLPMIAAGESVPLSAGSIRTGDQELEVALGDYGHEDELDAEDFLYRPDLIPTDVLSQYRELEMTGTCKDISGDPIDVATKFNPVFTEEGLAIHMDTTEVTEKLDGIRRELRRLSDMKEG